MSETPNRAELVAELEADARSSFGGGKQNNVTDLVLSMGAILFSLVAAVVAGIGDSPKWLAATFAALPAACASLQRVVDFRGRSNWYFQNAAKTRALAMQLKYADSPSLAEFSQRKAELEVDMEKVWAQIGGSQHKPAEGTRRRPDK